MMNTLFNFIKTYSIISSLFFLILSCSKENVSKKVALDSLNMEKFYLNEKPTLEIEIINIPKDSLNEIVVSFTKASLFKNTEPSKVIPLNENDKFKLQLDYSIPNQEIFLTIGNLYYGSISLSRDLKLLIDYEKIKKKPIWSYDDSITFYGSDSNLNLSLLKYNVFNIYEKQKTFQNLLEISRKKFNNFTDFKKTLDSLNQELIKTEISFLEQNQSNHNWYIGYLRENEYYSQLLTYTKQHKLSISKEIKDIILNRKTYGVTNSSDQFLRDQIYNLYGSQKFELEDWNKLYQFKNEDSKRFAKLDELLSIWRDQMNKKSVDNSKLENLKRKLYFSFISEWQLLGIEGLCQTIDSIYSPEKGDLLKLKLWSNDITYYNFEYKKINKNLKSNWAKDILRKEKEKLSLNDVKIQYNKAKVINNQLKTFDFGASLYNFEHLETKDQLITNILSINESKFNLIDFWATWCNPCYEEMKYSKALYEKIDKNKIEFIYLCTSANSSKEKWENTILNIKQKGIHIYANQDVVNELMSELSLNGFPSYALFNPKNKYLKGKITRIKTLTIDHLNEITTTDKQLE